MITLKKANIKDLEIVLTLYKKLHEYETRFSDEFDENWAYSKKGKTFFESRLKGYNSITLIAKEDGKLAGFALAHIASTIMRHRKKIAVLEYLYVEKDQRGKGVGTMLLQEIKKILKDKKMSRLKVVSFSANSDAISFYKKNGFSDFASILEGDL